MKYLLYIMNVIIILSLLPITILTLTIGITLIGIMIPIMILCLVAIIPTYILSSIYNKLIKYYENDDDDIIDIIRKE